MPTIDELANRRGNAALALTALGMQNVPADPEERIKADARYRLARDASVRAEREYQDALDALSTEELLALASRR